jgi:hypothetical protein
MTKGTSKQGLCERGNEYPIAACRVRTEVPEEGVENVRCELPASREGTPKAQSIGDLEQSIASKIRSSGSELGSGPATPLRGELELVSSQSQRIQVDRLVLGLILSRMQQREVQR